MDRVLRHSRLRPGGSVRIALPVLVVLLGVGGYLITSRTISSDRDAAAERRAQVGIVQTEGELDSADAAAASFEALRHDWRIDVRKEPPSGLQSTLPWPALAWPVAIALIVLLVGRAIMLRRRAERGYEQIYNLSPIMLCTIGFDGYYKHVNPSFARAFGYSPEELLTMSWEDLIHPDELEAARALFPRVVGGKELIGLEDRCIRADGTELLLHWNARPVPEEGVIYAIGMDVTERRRAEREAEEMFERSTDVLASAGFDGYFRRVNPAFVRTLGYSAEELRSRPYTEFLHPDDVERSSDVFAEIIQGRELVGFENRFVGADGSVHWIQWNVRPDLDEEVMYGVGRDVTESRRAQRDVERIWELSADILATVGFDGYYQRVNPSFQRTLGYSREELLSRPWSDFVHPDDLPSAREEFADVVHGKEVVRFETRFVCADGSERVLEWNARAVPEEGVIYGIARDLTDRRRLEREFEEVFNVSPDLLCIAGFDGYFKRVNPAFEEAFGYSSEELLSRPFLEFGHPDDLAASRGAFEALQRGETIARFENRNIRADGSILWLEWSTRPLVEEGIMYGAARDITERKRADAELREAQETVEASRAELAVYAEDQAALRRVATLVAQGAAPTKVLDAVAVEVAQLLEADSTRLLRYEPDGSVIVLATLGEISVHDPVGARLTIEGDNLPASVLRTGRPARMESYADARGSLAAVMRDFGFRSGIGTPITVEGRLWGVMIAAWTQPDRPLDYDTEGRLAQFTELVATAIANAESRAELAASRARVVAATAEERRRVVRDLHDGAQQRLVHAVIMLKLALRELHPGGGKAQGLVDEALDHAEQANYELRELVYGILPGALTSGGLRAGVEELVSRASLPVTVNVSPERFPPAIEATAYFVVSEALTNAVKHSRAEGVQVAAHVDNGALRVDVRDDGVGGADPSQGSGLTGLRDRVEALGGRIGITSPPGWGTSLSVKLPVKGG